MLFSDDGQCCWGSPFSTIPVECGILYHSRRWWLFAGSPRAGIGIEAVLQLLPNGLADQILEGSYFRFTEIGGDPTVSGWMTVFFLDYRVVRILWIWYSSFGRAGTSMTWMLERSNILVMWHWLRCLTHSSPAWNEFAETREFFYWSLYWSHVMRNTRLHMKWLEAAWNQYIYIYRSSQQTESKDLSLKGVECV